MRKDYILTPEEKESRKQRLEENRLLRSTLNNNNDINIKTENIIQPTTADPNYKSVRNVHIYFI